MVFCADIETFLYDKHKVLLFHVMDMGKNLPFSESLLHQYCSYIILSRCFVVKIKSKVHYQYNVKWIRGIFVVFSERQIFLRKSFLKDIDLPDLYVILCKLTLQTVSSTVKWR